MHLKEVGGLWVADPAVEGRVCLEGPAGAGDLVSKELGERASKIQGSQCLGPAGVLGRMGAGLRAKLGEKPSLSAASGTLNTVPLDSEIVSAISRVSENLPGLSSR
jgi:hypothetical protein